MTNKTVVYTSIFGSYDRLIPQKERKDIDFVCFTDQKLSSSSWKVITVEPPIKNDPVRSNRYFKINPHLVLPEYQQSVYIDGNFLIIHDIQHLIQCVFSKAHMGAFSHSPPVDNPANCIYEEHERIIKMAQERNKWLDDPYIMSNQMSDFKDEEYPSQHGLIAGGVLLRKHLEEDVIQTMDLWWDIVKNKSKRDQLSFNFAAWKTGLNFVYIPGEVRYDNPWFWRLGGHNQALWFRTLKYDIRKALGIIHHPSESEFLNEMQCA